MIREKGNTNTLCQGERIPDKEIDALILALNNVWRIVYQQRSDITQAKNLLTMAVESQKKGESLDIGQIDSFLNRKW